MKHYPASVASKATGTPLKRIQSYLERNQIQLQPCDIHSPGSGLSRGYSMRRLLQIAITTQLTHIGVSASRASKAAYEFSDRANVGRAPGELFSQGRTLLVGLGYGQNKVFHIAPDQTLDDVIPREGASFVLDCGWVVKTLKKNLDIQ